MRALSILLAAAAFAASTSVALAAHTWTANLGPGRNATQPGKVTIVETNANEYKVTLEVTAMDATTPQPAHIHSGGCPGVGPVVVPLTSVVNGRSETTVNGSLKTLLSSQHAINIHKSAAEAAVYTACVDLPAGTVHELKPGRNDTQPGYAVLGDKGAQTRVSLVMVPGSAGPTVPQPAHVHVGGCPGVGAVAFPLSTVVNGTSDTTINASVAQLMGAQHAINVHRSASEAAVYTACVDIPLAQRAAAPAQLPRTGGTPLGLVVLLGSAFAGVGVALRRR